MNKVTLKDNPVKLSYLIAFLIFCIVFTGVGFLIIKSKNGLKTANVVMPTTNTKLNNFNSTVTLRQKNFEGLGYGSIKITDATIDETYLTLAGRMKIGILTPEFVTKILPELTDKGVSLNVENTKIAGISAGVFLNNSISRLLNSYIHEQVKGLKIERLIMGGGDMILVIDNG